VPVKWLVVTALLPFHPAVRAWFKDRLGEPTAPQLDGWPLIREGRHTLIAAPTGSGKTLAAFLSAIDSLLRQGAGLKDETQVLYVSPLRALSNDVEKNLLAPLAGIRHELGELGLPDVEIRTAVRTGDTPAKERTRATGKPPHLFVTTIAGGPLASPYATEKATAMVNTDFIPGFPLQHAAKDAAFAAEAAHLHGLQLPLTEALLDRWNQAIASGHGRDDVAAIITATAATAVTAAVG